MTWELITDYSQILPGQKLDGTGWDVTTGTRLTTFHGVVLEVQEITEGPFRSGLLVLFERDAQGSFVPGTIITGPDVCRVYVWAIEEAAPVEVEKVADVWPLIARGQRDVRYYWLSTECGHVPIPALEAQAMIADGRAKLVDRADYLRPLPRRR